MDLQMGALEIIFGIVLIIFSIAIVAVVLFQEGNQKSLGAISGGADNFIGKSKARGVDAMLERMTRFVAIGFFLLTVAVNIVVFFA